MRKLPSTLAASLAVLAAAASLLADRAPATQPAAASRATFTSAKHGFTLTYPRTLRRQKVDVPTIDLLLIEPRETEKTLNHVQVMVVPTRANEELDALTRSMSDLLSRDGAPPAVQPLTLAGKPAQGFDFTQTVEDEPVKVHRLVCVHNGNAYVITTVAPPEQFDAFLPQAMSIVDSFQWTE